MGIIENEVTFFSITVPSVLHQFVRMKKKKTKQILKVVFVFISIGSLYFVPWIVIWAWILPLPHTVQDQLNEAVVHGSDGIIVYIDQGGKPPSLYAAGWHDRKNRVPVNPQALFKIANITKLYITVATAKLVHANRLSLDKTLADYIPSILGKIKNADKITLRMLVKHRSGIPNITDTPNFWKNLPHNNSAAFKLITALPTHFEPDEAYEYSNSNYLLISIIIDKILGYNHQQFIKEEILIPHRLNNTFGSISEVNSNEVMSGYFTGFETLILLLSSSLTHPI